MNCKRIEFKLFILLFLLVVGCQAQSAGLTNTRTVTPTAAATKAALSYDEIQRNIQEMLAAAGQASGPEVGPDGIVDKALQKEIDEYSDSIKGSRAENWSGWFLHSEWLEGPWLSRPPFYAVGILMSEAAPDTQEGSNVSLYIYEITPEQESRLKSLQPGQSIVFSGTLLGVNAFGEIYVENGIIEPAK